MRMAGSLHVMAVVGQRGLRTRGIGIGLKRVVARQIPPERTLVVSIGNSQIPPRTSCDVRGGMRSHGTIRSTSPSSGANEMPQFDVYSAPSGPSTSPLGRLANPARTFVRLPVLRSNLTRLAVSVDH